ncbi:MAG: class I SAM-dependent methyltransferase [Thermoguttaceae bacterium]|nr:class I SAM-dependent methyltransferase [Thermoguttaceae bacterium]
MNSTNEKDFSAFRIAFAIQKYIRPGSSVLDVGFGNCEMLKILTAPRLHCRYTGIDVDPECVSKAQKVISKCHLESECTLLLGADLESMQGQFDYCVCSRLIHHLPLREFRQTLEKMMLTLKPEGTLLLVDSIRDYRTRPDRFLYTPYSILNELSDLFPGYLFVIQPNPSCKIDVEDLWLQSIRFGERWIYSFVEKIRLKK